MYGGLVVLFASGCGARDTQSCTEIGCSPEVVLAISQVEAIKRAVQISFCVDSDCRSAVAQPEGSGYVVEGDAPLSISAGGGAPLQVSFPLGEAVDPDVPHRVRATVTVGGRVVASVDEDVELERFEPNGPGCPPVCWRAVLEAA